MAKDWGAARAWGTLAWPPSGFFLDRPDFRVHFSRRGGGACLLIRKHDHFTPAREMGRDVRALTDPEIDFCVTFAPILGFCVTFAPILSGVSTSDLHGTRVFPHRNLMIMRFQGPLYPAFRGSIPTQDSRAEWPVEANSKFWVFLSS